MCEVTVVGVREWPVGTVNKNCPSLLGADGANKLTFAKTQLNSLNSARLKPRDRSSARRVSLSLAVTVVCMSLSQRARSALV